MRLSRFAIIDQNCQHSECGAAISDYSRMDQYMTWFRIHHKEIASIRHSRPTAGGNLGDVAFAFGKTFLCEWDTYESC